MSEWMWPNIRWPVPMLRHIFNLLHSISHLIIIDGLLASCPGVGEPVEGSVHTAVDVNIAGGECDPEFAGFVARCGGELDTSRDSRR